MELVSCDRCGKAVPSSNIMLHQAQCMHHNEALTAAPATAAVVATVPAEHDGDEYDRMSVRELKRWLPFSAIF